MALGIPIISSFDSKGIDQARKEFSQLEGVGPKASHAITSAAIPAAAAIAGIGAALFDATKGAIEDEAAQIRLKGVLEKTTGASDDQVKAVESFISAQSRASGLSDDVLRPAFAKLVTASGDVETAQKDLTLAMDIAQATGKPLEAVTNALAKAQNGSYDSLKKLNPKMTDLIKSGAETDVIFADLSKTFGGATAENADTVAGKFAIMKVSLDETKESIGAALLPALEKVLPYLVAFGDWASEHPGIILAIGAAIATIAAAIVAVNIAMALNPFSLIAIALAGFGALLVTAYKEFEPFKTVVDTVFGTIQWWINTIILPLIVVMVDAFKLAIGGIKILFDGLKTTVGKVFEKIGDAVEVSLELIKGYFTGLMGFYKTLFNGVAKLWNNSFGKLNFSIPKWVPIIGGNKFDVPDIPMLANGGIVNSPTLAMIGEAGPEAVIPLDRMGSMGGNITVNVNGGLSSSAEIGQAVVNAIRSFNVVNGPARIKVA